WMFVSDLFHTVILADRPARKSVPVDARLELYRRRAFAAVCGVCALLCVAFLWSWMGYAKLLDTVQAGGRRSVKPDVLSELRSLDGLRVQIQQLTPWPLRWSFYSGSQTRAVAKEAYFRRFQQVLLNDLNSGIVARLAAAPGAAPGPDNSYDRTYRILKTHLMISSGACKTEPAYAARVLKEAREDVPQLAGFEFQALADRQIDFYASELPSGNPCQLAENGAARDRARQYLSQIKGIGKIYSGILAGAEKSLPKPQRLADLAPNYTKVLNGPNELSAAFTRDGWAFVEK